MESLGKENGQKVHPRERTITDPKKEVKEEMTNKREVVIMMDANEGPESQAEEMNDMIQEFRSVDTGSILRNQQIEESVRGTMAGSIAHVIHPEPFQGFPYQPKEVTKWKEEYDQ